MRFFLFSFLIVFFPSISYSQDTIFTRDNNQIIVKIIEINHNKISYSINDSISSINSSLVSIIKYSNGNVDDFNIEKEQTLSSVNINNQNDENILVDKAAYIMKTKVYSASRINEYMLKTCKHDPELLTLLEKSKKDKRNRAIFGRIGIGLLGVTAVSVFTVPWFVKLNNYHYIAAVSGVTLGFTGIGIAIGSDVRMHIHTRETVKLYNQKF